MIVCSVSTLLLNGNPLLRYDGYYVLADWLEVPNLGQQSQALLNRLLAGFFLGIVPPADRSLPAAVARTAGRLCRAFRPLPLADRAGHPLVLLSRGENLWRSK